MNRQQAIHVLELIRDLYPRYNISKEKAEMLIPALLPMDYERVRENLAVYVATHPYAPTIAEIAANPVEKNESFDQLDAWREEAANVPVEIKQNFQRKMVLLLEGKGI